jgi:chromosome segregation ATPase
VSFNKLIIYATDGARFPNPYQNKEMTMKSPALQIAVLLPIALLAASLLSVSGCNKQEATKELKEMEAAAEEGAAQVAEDVEAAVEEGEKMASELGEKAMEYLTPLKDELSSLDELKATPEELKARVSEIIESIETKAEGIELPETVTKALEGIKEKLIALRDYLQGEFEQSKIDEHVKEIMDSVKSGLGMSQD